MQHPMDITRASALLFLLPFVTGRPVAQGVSTMFSERAERRAAEFAAADSARKWIQRLGN